MSKTYYLGVDVAEDGDHAVVDVGHHLGLLVTPPSHAKEISACKKKDGADLTIARLSFFDYTGRVLTSRRPFCGVMHISLLSISISGTISLANGIHTC
jgi:hypothetical protein